ncbi:MAG: hypothetical protein U9P42_08040 [Candidatus Fermentibacteria bacterium]|nr:hypothetical protein [Candidatus Fermentibacteria bacterium]
MTAGDFRAFDYSYTFGEIGNPSDSTRSGTHMWLVNGVVNHDQGFELLSVTVTDSIVRYFQSVPVDTVFTEITEYYRVSDSEVSYYYSLSDTTSWLLLDLPLVSGKTWYDVENALYTVMTVDTTLSLPFGIAEGCALIQATWGQTLSTCDDRYYEPDLGLVKRVYHKEDANVFYTSIWELTASNLIN